MRISIVTISFNQNKYLAECLNSVSAQLELGDEHIVVDPGSTDGSRDTISDYIRNSSFARSVFEKDSGPADGLNNGFKIASGEILAYLNADDFLLPGALHYVRAFFSKRPEVDVLIGAIKMADAGGRLRLRGRVADTPCFSRLRTGYFQYYQQGTFFTRAVFNKTNGFNERNRTSWDSELIIDMLLKDASFMVSTRPLGAFRMHNESITGSGGQSGAAYLADRKRVLSKSGYRKQEQGFDFFMYKIESRFNPIRIIKQFRPCLF